MSATDFRQMIELHDGAFVAFEVSDGVNVVMNVNGEATTLNLEAAYALRTRLLVRLDDMSRDAFNFITFGIGPHTVEANYYDAGVIFDALAAAIRTITDAQRSI